MKTQKNEITNRVEAALATIEKIDRGFDSDQPAQVQASIATIKILRESQAFEFPDQTKLDSFTGNIVFYHRTNSYFSGSYDPDAQAQCQSIDGIMPTGGENPRHGPCNRCPLNEWGSAESGNGKACGNYLNIFLLREYEEIPYLLRCPPTSLAKRGALLTFLTYAPSVVKKAVGSKAYQLIVTEFTLKRENFASRVSSVLVPRVARVLDVKKDTERIETLMMWYRRIRGEWEANRAGPVGLRQDIEAANAGPEAKRENLTEVEDESDDDNGTDDAESTEDAVTNPEYVGDNPKPVDANDPIPF